MCSEKSKSSESKECRNSKKMQSRDKICHLPLPLCATKKIIYYTMGKKSRIQHCERSELRLHLRGQKFIKNFNRTKLGGNAKIERFKCDISGHFQTM